jgi:3-hydroxyisobutyrate dehydrogenase-like beta-hydroxyacid dehydrogenase
MLVQLGLHVEHYGSEIGRASTFKLLRSVFSKGMEALLMESLIAARRAGLADELWREIVELLQQRSFADVGANWIRTHATAHERRYHEVVQAENLLSELGVESLLTPATAAFFERSTRLRLSDHFEVPPQAALEVVDVLDKLLGNP